MIETLLHVTAHTRGPARLDDPELDAADPSIAALTALGATNVVLVGGEPTLRADLPELLAAFPSATLRTDGLALAQSATLRELRAAGLGTLRIVLHSARPEAHDWLVGQAGAARRAMRTLLTAAELGIPTEIEATLTRPTAPHIAELVVLAEGVHARAVHLVRLAHRGLAAREAIMLTPRFGLLEDPLTDAGAAAIRARIALHVHGFPRCVAPSLGTAMEHGTRVRAFVDDAAWSAIARAHDVPFGLRCGSCPGESVCSGAPADYVACFGDAEIASESPRRERARVPVAGLAVPPRAGRAPTTRLRDIRSVVRRGAVEGDPLIDAPSVIPQTITITFAPIDTSTRVLRAKLIRAAQEGAAVLRISGGFDHPRAPELLREAARLPGPDVEIAGDLSPLHAWSDAQLFELAGLARAVSIATPAQRTEAEAFLARLARIAKIAGDFEATTYGSTVGPDGATEVLR